jgi:hypothetical protein
MRRALSTTAAVLLAALLAAGPGCGDNDSAAPKPPSRLSPEEQVVLQDAQQAVRRYCRKVGLYILRQGRAPTPADLEQVDARLGPLVAIGRERPAALSSSQRTVRESIGDLIEDVEGSNCSGPIQQRLDAAIAEIPPP